MSNRRGWAGNVHRFGSRALPLVLLMVGGWAGIATAQDEPVEEAALPLRTLRECVLIALEESPTLLTARAEKEIADQDVTAAWGTFLPDLTLSHTYSKSNRTDFGVDQYGAQYHGLETIGGDTLYVAESYPTGTTADEKIESKYKDLAVAANMNLFEGMAKYSRLGSARATSAAREASRRWTVELVIQNVAMAYFNLLLYLELEDVAADTRDLAQQELERTETYFRLGSAAKSDVLQQRVRLEQTRLDLVVAENRAEQAFADLAYAMNQPLAQRFNVDRTFLETDFALESLAGLYDEALSNRLDLQSSEENLRARSADVTTASSNFWPRIDLFLNYTRYNNESPYRFGSQESQDWRYGYQVSWNVFDRLTTLTGRSKAKANERIAEYNLEQSRLDAQLEIRQLFNIMVEAREKAGVSRETIAQSQEELRLATERFRVGAGTTLDLINAQVNLGAARAEEVRAIVEFMAAKVQLDRAVGRFSQYSESVE